MEFRFKVFGTLVAVRGSEGKWQAFYLGAEGKRRPADFIIPADVPAGGLGEYLADLFHEDATPKHNTVEQLSPLNNEGQSRIIGQLPRR